MNNILIIGNLTRNPELTETASGVKVCRFSVAVSRKYDKEKTDFFTCTAWRNLAEIVAKYTEKGKKVAVSGSMQFNEYTDKDGIKRISADIQADDVEFLSPTPKAEDKQVEKPSAIKQFRQALMEEIDSGDSPF